MLNKNGNTENLEEYHSNGKLSYQFLKRSNGYSYEYTFDKNGNTLTYKNSKGYYCEYTRDKNGDELTFKDSDGVKRGFEEEELIVKEEVQTDDQPQEEKAKAEPNAILISRELANGLFKYFTEKPHLIEEIEHFVNGLRSGIPVHYTPEEPKS
tara:strand:+ start:2678 stop:3136 length:459 start_codon:yes stop_codon:yes gene_type:complete